jgi:hypothetical protein
MISPFIVSCDAIAHRHSSGPETVICFSLRKKDSKVLIGMRRRRQADYRYLQAKYELTLNDEDEIDFNIQAMRRPMIIGRTKCNHWS